ncbi:membrane protein [Azorhizobium oxalatiphilum]|uniref:Membrane protein n=1 Tax=Azorhizobium oxalatiphilum TaxID=980631 RepID=A0A917FLP9_9HYPH|nr:outer membrane protein [Azorhizobium oxalatiphilum]GGF88454.1 membrane protein [Azorhizobium oxalatiphilum]
MNTRFLAGLAGLALAATPMVATPSAAADLSGRYGYGYAPAQAAPLPSWTGFYVGANAGYGWGSAAGMEPSGFVGGIQGGYNLQFAGSPFMVGVETDFNWSGQSDGPFKLNNLGTIRARAGITSDRILVYGTLGAAYGQGEYQVAGLSNSQTSWGWALGAGAEYALDRNWSARAEYMYVDLGDSTYGSWFGPTSAGYDGSVLRAGVNYRF